MSALDRIPVVPLMFLRRNAALASLPGHAKVSGTRGGHARGPLARGINRAYLRGSPGPKPVTHFADALLQRAQSYGLK